MAKSGQSELSALRKAAAAYVKRLIRLGLAAQTVASAGGSQSAISRLISSGIALASQLQRGVVIRVVAASLVRRRSARPARRGAPEEHPEAPPLPGVDARAGDQGDTGWEGVVPASLALADVDSQPFSLARALPALVAAQESTFRALSSVDGVVSRAVGVTGFSQASSRAPPSSTSLEPVQRGSPDVFPEGQATAFAVGASFRTVASSMVFNLSRAASEAASASLGSQAVGASFAPPQPRAANEGTGPGALSPRPAPQPLLQQSITGSGDTSFRSAPPGGANLGLFAGLGAPSPSLRGAQPPSSLALPLSGEPNPPSGLSAQVEAPPASSSRASAPADSWESGAGGELNAGQYAVPGGLGSLLSSPAFAAGSQLSMQVRSLASSGPPAALPVRSSRQPHASEGLRLDMDVVAGRYPSSYPSGAAYSVRGMVASLGLVRSAPSSGAPSASQGGGRELTYDEAPGMEDDSKTVGGAFVGGSLDARGSVSAGTSLAPAETGPSEPQLIAGGPGPHPDVFGDRWLASIAAAAGAARVVTGVLTAAGSSPSGSASLQVGPDARTSGAAFPSGVQRAEAPPSAEPGSGLSPAARTPWEAATLLPGILTPSNAPPLAGQSSVGLLGIHEPDSLSSLEGAVRSRSITSAPRGAVEALRVAASARNAVVASSLAAMGALGQAESIPRGGVARPAPAFDGASIPERGAPTSLEPAAEGAQEPESAPPPVALSLSSLLSLAASRALLAARLAGTSAGTPSPLTEAARRPGAVQGPAATASPTGTAWREVGARPLGPAPSPRTAEAVAGERPAGTAPAGAGGELDAALATGTRPAWAEPERAFFGLDAVARALSLASKVPSAAAPNAVARPTAGGRTASNTERRGRSKGAPDGTYPVEQSPLLVEGSRLAPEDALAKMLGEQPRQSPIPDADQTVEPDDRELRRRIERILEEELRRHGYQP